MRYIVWMKLFEYLWVRNGKICHLWAEPVGQRQSGTSTESGYRYPLDRGKVVPVPIKMVQVPTHQKGLVPVPIKVVAVLMLPTTFDFCTLALLSPKFVHRKYKNPNK